jgi:hypothetical protein
LSLATCKTQPFYFSFHFLVNQRFAYDSRRAAGSKHDFQLFKDNGGDFAEQLCILADAGAWQSFMKIAKRLSRNPNITC